ncbi:MAG: phage tail protein [SAR202 cluster bacterium]|nr:phage tail protein [SAR202 cluster bacterium]
MVTRLLQALITSEELAACRFAVDIDGLWVAEFKECTGLSGQVEVETYQEGGLNGYEHKLPGRITYGNLTLRSGVANSMDLWDWFQNMSQGVVERRDVSVILFAQNGGEVMRWNLTGAFPVSWQGPDFAAGATEVAVHSLELTHNGISLSKPNLLLRALT